MYSGGVKDLEKLAVRRKIGPKEGKMSIGIFFLLVVAGFVSGFVNTLAGSGSLISLPALMLAGLTANAANGTNRVAILLQCLASSGEFKRLKVLDLKGAIYLGLPATLGAIVGAQIAVNVPEEIMRKVIGLVMLAMLGSVILRPEQWIKGKIQAMEKRPGWKELAIFFAIGVYGGFIQAGVGIFLLAGLVLGVGYDLVRANAVKMAIVLIYTMAALLIFAGNNQVEWRSGFILALGSIVGAWVATRFSVEWGAIWVRRFLILVVLISAAHLFGLF
jgi:uncharacterized membrane protein YfcA